MKANPARETTILSIEGYNAATPFWRDRTNLVAPAAAIGAFCRARLGVCATDVGVEEEVFVGNDIVLKNIVDSRMQVVLACVIARRQQV